MAETNQTEEPKTHSVVAVFIYDSKDDPDEDIQFGELLQSVKGLYDLSGKEGFRAYVIVEERANDIVALLEKKND